MKKAGKILTAILLMVLAITTQAQQTDDYFTGKWKVIGNSPMGEVLFTVKLERVDGVLTGNIQREGEAEPVKFSKVAEIEMEIEITVYFLSSSGYDVDMNLKKKDDNNISGWAMGSYSVIGERID